MQLIQHTLLIFLTQETILHFNNQEHFSKLYITISAFKPLQLLFTLILHRHGIANVRSDESSYRHYLSMMFKVITVSATHKTRVLHV